MSEHADYVRQVMKEQDVGLLEAQRYVERKYMVDTLAESDLEYYVRETLIKLVEKVYE